MDLTGLFLIIEQGQEVIDRCENKGRSLVVSNGFQMADGSSEALADLVLVAEVFGEGGRREEY